MTKINIFHYERNITGEGYRWHKRAALTWAQYLDYARNVSGEGKTWRAVANW
jgi:predicted transcriptional regulator